jgi:hypothetical protein
LLYRQAITATALPATWIAGLKADLSIIMKEEPGV